MTALPLHPAIVHVPLGVSVVVPIVILVFIVALARGKVTRRAFLVVALLQAAVVAGAGASIATGESEEERREGFVPKAAVGRHEEHGEVFLAMAALSLAVTLATASAPTRWTRRLAIGSEVASLVVAAAAMAVGHSGGELVYGAGSDVPRSAK